MARKRTAVLPQQSPRVSGVGVNPSIVVISERRPDVYVLCFGERGEGHSPVRAFTSLKAAKEHALLRFGAMVKLESHGIWMGLRKADVYDNQVDQVWIYRMRVFAE